METQHRVTPTITAVRPSGRRVAVELDGRPWRTVPLEAAVAARLSPGVGLDRERVRDLARALRRHRAESVVLRAVARREHTRATLELRLERAGVEKSGRRDVLERAARAGLVDDGRYAATRARQLVERGAGDELVVDDLVHHGVAESLARETVAQLEPERDRAARIVAARGLSPRTARFLAAKGFAADVVEDVVAELASRALR
jgi:regulatory protein